MALKPLDRIPQSLSLRTQLVLITSMLIALSIAVTSLVAISALRAQMVHQLDEEMKNSAPSLVQLATVRPSGNQEQSLSTYRLYLLDKDGNVLYSLQPCSAGSLNCSLSSDLSEYSTLQSLSSRYRR